MVSFIIFKIFIEITLCLFQVYSKVIQLSVQFNSVTQLCPTICDPMNRSTPGLPVYHQLRSSLRLTSIKSAMPSSHLILCCPLLLLPGIPRSIRVFSSESTLCVRWPKYWSFSFSIIPSKEISVLPNQRFKMLNQRPFCQLKS